MGTAKNPAPALGDTWEAPESGAFVRRPDGSVVNVGPGGGHILDVPGTYTVVVADGKDGASVTVKD